MHGWSVMYIFFVVACSVVCPARGGAAQPNIVILYADDLGYGDVQCYNPDRGKIPTPRIDGLAAEVPLADAGGSIPMLFGQSRDGWPIRRDERFAPCVDDAGLQPAPPVVATREQRIPRG